MPLGKAKNLRKMKVFNEGKLSTYPVRRTGPCHRARPKVLENSRKMQVFKDGKLSTYPVRRTGPCHLARPKVLENLRKMKVYATGKSQKPKENESFQ